MDRNLGALEAVADAAAVPALSTYGLYYQWGRKDPMFTSNWKRNATLDLAYSGSSSAGACVSTDESIKTPTTFYYSEANGTYNWNTEEIEDLWDDSSDKTIYDPCPAGYRVPKYDASYAMWKSGSGTGWTSDAINGWFKFGEITFPYAGYASSSSISYSGKRTVIWSAKYNSVERGYCGYIRSDKDPIYNYNSYYKPYLASVRCCLIDGEVSKPEVVLTGASNVVIDGSFSEWESADAITTSNSRIKEWKFGNDANNLYFYYKILKEKIVPEEGKDAYEWDNYIYVGIDADGSIQQPVGTAVADAHVTVFGAFDGDYCYLEISIPRSAIGTLGSKIGVAHCMSYSDSGMSKVVIPIK